MADDHSGLQIFEGLSSGKDLHYVAPGLGLGVGSENKGEEDLCKVRKSFLSELSENEISCLEDD